MKRPPLGPGGASCAVRSASISLADGHGTLVDWEQNSALLGRCSSVAEQLFRKQQAGGSNPPIGSSIHQIENGPSRYFRGGSFRVRCANQLPHPYQASRNARCSRSAPVAPLSGLTPSVRRGVGIFQGKRGWPRGAFASFECPDADVQTAARLSGVVGAILDDLVGGLRYARRTT